MCFFFGVFFFLFIIKFAAPLPFKLNPKTPKLKILTTLKFLIRLNLKISFLIWFDAHLFKSAANCFSGDIISPDVINCVVAGHHDPAGAQFRRSSFHFCCEWVLISPLFQVATEARVIRVEVV